MFDLKRIMDNSVNTIAAFVLGAAAGGALMHIKPIIGGPEGRAFEAIYKAADNLPVTPEAKDPPIVSAGYAQAACTNYAVSHFQEQADAQNRTVALQPNFVDSFAFSHTDVWCDVTLTEFEALPDSGH